MWSPYTASSFKLASLIVAEEKSMLRLGYLVRPVPLAAFSGEGSQSVSLLEGETGSAAGVCDGDGGEVLPSSLRLPIVAIVFVVCVLGAAVRAEFGFFVCFLFVLFSLLLFIFVDFL